MDNSELINMIASFLVTEWKWVLTFLFGLLSLTWFMANHLSKVEVKNLERRLEECKEHNLRIQELTSKEVESSKAHVLELKERINNQKEILAKFDSLSDREKKELVKNEEKNNEKSMKTIDIILEKSALVAGILSKYVI